jgi:release factor glutamine methyltransferase
MKTIATARMWAAGELNRTGTQSPMLSADLLLGFVLGRDRVYILGHSEFELPEDLDRRFRLLVFRHAAGEPLQYLTGEREFYGRDFHVTPAVLIPRPETEILVEKAVRIIQDDFSSDVRFADVGTGSGCIAVSVACDLPSTIGCAIDISREAVSIAGLNAARHKVSDRIRFLQGDLLNCFRPQPIFDLIVCNPPYVALEECDTLPSGVRDYEPHLALFGGRDGLDVYRRLIPMALQRLNSGGFLLLEAGAGQADRICRLIEEGGLALEEILNDLQDIPRCIVARNAEM